MPEKMNLFQRFIASISKYEAYQTFMKESTGRAVMYLLLLSLLFSGLTSVKHIALFNVGLEELSRAIAYEMPNFEIRNGVLSVDAKMPIIIDESAENLIVIDTSGTLDQSVLHSRPQGIFISAHEFVQKNNAQTNSFRFTDLQGFYINKATLLNWLPFLRWISAFILIFGFIFYFLGKLISAFFISLLGLVVQAVVNHKVGFGNLYKISIYALTLPLLIKLVVDLAGVIIPRFWFIYYGLAIYVIWKALQTLKDRKEAEELSDNGSTLL